MVGIVLVSHSSELARGPGRLAGQMAGPTCASNRRAALPAAASAPTTTACATPSARANQGDGVVVLGDLGSAILTVRHVLERNGNGHVRLVDAPLVEGAVAAAVIALAGQPLDDAREPPRRHVAPRKL